jgi:hypothetical protein
MQAIKTLPQRRLAGAILAQERMALTSISLKGHAIAGHDAQKALGDAASCDQR